jgi:ABC-type phosphate/phosphonate transport system substrate-binding protein
MRFKPGFLITLAGIGLAATQAGCHRGASSASFLSIFGLSEKPVVVALAAKTGTLDPFAPHEKLRKAMSETIKRPVRLDLCFPIQLAPNLKLGFYDFALVSPACYAEMGDRESFEIVAASVDEAGHAAHSAVLVVAADSELTDVADLRDKKVAFGRRDDARTHHAGLALLSKHGLEKGDLSLSLLPVPGSLKHFSEAPELARAVQNGDFDAGFIDEAVFEQLQCSPASQHVLDRERLRVIARTEPVPDMLVIQSPKADPETVETVTEFLLAAGQTHPEALRPLLCSAYQTPSDDVCAWSEHLSMPPEATTEECK